MDVEVARCLVREQMPGWAHLDLRPVEHGWDNRTFRLGHDMAVRLPSDDRAAAQVDKEHRWLPVLAPHVPVPVPVPLARGAPGCGFPRPWSVYRWIDGTTVAAVPAEHIDRLADDLAGALVALQEAPTAGGPRPGPHCHYQGGPLATFDDAVRATLDQLEPDDRIDTDAAREVWDAALDATWKGLDVWVHGDVTGSNLLVVDGRLCGVIDFGCAVVGDPACDLAPAWTTFDGASRQRFLRAAAADEAMCARARGWVLWKAIAHLPDLADDHPRNDGTRLGWRWGAASVVDQVVSDHRSSGRSSG